ncbi:MAG: carboxylesterase family protein [Xanthobacteraceae bacterium]
MIAESFKDSAARARTLYVDPHSLNVRASVAAMFADTQFNNGARGVARGLTRKGVDVYRYLLLRRRPNSGPPNHGDDVPYVFASLAAAARLDPAPFDADDEALAEAIQDAWIRFATTGNPNGGTMPQWPTSDSSERYMEFDTTIQTGTGWRKQHLDFIDEYFGG